MEEEKIMRVIVHGKVQGVFFRATACKHGNSLGLSGTAKNLPDGTVELWAQGNQENLELFLEILEDDPGMGEVERYEVTYPETCVTFSNFQIVY